MPELVVSNIAWTNEEEPDVAKKLIELGVKYVEIAPTKLWPDPTQVSDEEALEYVKWWSDQGINISAFQSMLFNRPDLKIFGSEELREESMTYLSKLLELAGKMGVGKLVFGSPKNRQRGEISIDRANDIAVGFFRGLGEVAARNETTLCIEPNAPQYNCDYVTNGAEGDNLVRLVDHAGFKLHLDTACMALAGDDVKNVIHASRDILEHFHVSSPMLEQVEDRGDVDHVAAAQALRDIQYNKFISIEMRPAINGENVERVEKAVRFVQEVYNS